MGRKTNTYLTLISLKILLTTIEKKPMTQPEIMEITGLANSTVSRWLQKLHTRPSLVYIHSYRRVGTRGNWSKVWAAGFHGTDAIKPKPMEAGQYQKRWRNKKLTKPIITIPEQGVIRHVSQ